MYMYYTYLYTYVRIYMYITLCASPWCELSIALTISQPKHGLVHLAQYAEITTFVANQVCIYNVAVYEMRQYMYTVL